MISISEHTLDRLGAIPTPLGRVLRLDLHRAGRLSLTFGGPRPDDQVVQHQGRELVHISAHVSSSYEGAVLRFRGGPTGELVLSLPANANRDHRRRCHSPACR